MTLTLEEPVATFTLPDVTEEEVETLANEGASLWGVRINPEHKREWCDALRSGRFQQIRGSLVEGKTGRCAMGVLSSITEMEVREYLMTLAVASAWQRRLARDPLAVWLGVSDGEYSAISSLVINWNDIFAMSFAEIADRIEREF